MLSRQLLLRQQLTRMTCVIKNTRYSSSQVAPDLDLTGTAELRLSPRMTKKPNREPFAKNLFLGKFDVEFLAFPEPQTHNRHQEFFEWLKPIEDYIKEEVDPREIDTTKKIPDRVFEDFKKLGIFRAAVHESYGGLGLNVSEYTKLVETVSAVPAFGTYLTRRAAIVKIINDFGTEEQKSNILPKIATGEIIPALCFSESPTGTTAEPLETKATLDFNIRNYIINGHKTYVVDAANANLFVVMALHSSSDVHVKDDRFWAFLIPADAEGIVISKPIPMLGQLGLNVYDVTFNDVSIPKDDKLGDEIAQEELFISCLGDSKHNVGGQAIGILKRFLDMLTDNIIMSKNFNVKRKSHDLMHEPVARIASTLYAMEAVTYMTTGMIDSFENQDCTLEKSLVEAFCVNSCIQMILYGTQLLGSSAYNRNENFERMLRDALALTALDRSTADTKIFAALLGIQHTGVTIGAKVKHSRNPLQYPIQVLKMVFEINIDPNLRLDENLHPSLRISATSLEKSVHNLRRCLNTMIVDYGIHLMTHKMELKRLADVIIEIYVMAAVVSRASRSYCIGLRNAEQEVQVAMIYTNSTYEKVNLLVKELTEGDYSNGDHMLKEIAESMFQKKAYFASHPLERTY